LLQEETQEYASEAKLRELVKKYSEFINFPIYLYDSKEVDVPVEEGEDEDSKADSDEIEDEGLPLRPACWLRIQKRDVLLDGCWVWILEKTFGPRGVSSP